VCVDVIDVAGARDGRSQARIFGGCAGNVGSPCGSTLSSWCIVPGGHVERGGRSGAGGREKDRGKERGAGRVRDAPARTEHHFIMQHCGDSPVRRHRGKQAHHPNTQPHTAPPLASNPSHACAGACTHTYRILSMAIGVQPVAEIRAMLLLAFRPASRWTGHAQPAMKSGFPGSYARHARHARHVRMRRGTRARYETETHPPCSRCTSGWQA